jgi:6-phosphogluconate dehydrogenase
MNECDFGLTGLAVMGQNLARNVARNGFSIAVHNRTASKTDEFVSTYGTEGRIVGPHDARAFVAALRRPRAVMIMVKAGPPVDEVVAELLEFLEPGDVIVDGGNSHFTDTIRREAELKARGILFLGTGVSGGEEGALNGPSIMPGGPPEAYERVKPNFTRIAAQVKGEPCCTYIGADGAGHYVKMVHNGIEYADMQLIAEAYDLMRSGLGLSAAELSGVFAEWNAGDLDSYLIGITSEVLAKTDEETGKPLVDMILDTAAQKGTGKWTSQDALDLGIPATSITEAVFARCLSALKHERVVASKTLPGPKLSSDTIGSIDDIRDALYASKICCYAQGFQLMDAAAAQYGWKLDRGAIASIWRGGCIIRARFLDRIKEAYAAHPDLANLMLAPYFTDAVARGQAAWRRVVAGAAQNGIPAPGFSSALAYYDGYRRERLPANLIQGLRDYFGAHTYKRIDKDGDFHTQW